MQQSYLTRRFKTDLQKETLNSVLLSEVINAKLVLNLLVKELVFAVNGIKTT